MARLDKDPAVAAAAVRSTGSGKNRVTSNVATNRNVDECTGSRDSTTYEVFMAPTSGSVRWK